MREDPTIRAALLLALLWQLKRLGRQTHAAPVGHVYAAYRRGLEETYGALLSAD